MGPPLIPARAAESAGPRGLGPDAAGVESVIAFDKVTLSFDEHVVLRGVSFAIRAGQMLVLLGASGAGKSVILQLILGFLKPDAGAIHVGGRRIDTLSEAELMHVRGDIGMLFQESALFDSLSVADNVGYRLIEELHVPLAEARRRVEEILAFIGLEAHIDKMPSELSGGQRRRVAIARAVAARPRLLLFDSPTSGLDPITARTVDAEIVKLRDLERVTSILVTHQLDDAFYVATHEAVREGGRVAIRAAQRPAGETRFLLLKDGLAHFEGSLADLRASSDPYVRRFIA